MRIYLAGAVQSGFVYRGNSQSENVLLSQEVLIAYPYDLESYHYIKDNDLAPDYFAEIKKTIFLDSGAFSMFTQGIEVNLERYAEYVDANHKWIHIASNIDEIGKGKEQASYDNQKRLERLIKKVPVCPVHHARDDDKWLERYLADGYDYIFLGGMVPESTKYLRTWLDALWDKYLTKKDGTAKLKVHGFGLTTLELIERYPWYSVDSTSWVLLGRFGGIYLDLPNGRDVKIIISDQSPKLHDDGQHFDTMKPYDKEIVTARIKELGFEPELLRSMYGMRDKFNVMFFRRLCDRLNPTFRKKQIGVFD